MKDKLAGYSIEEPAFRFDPETDELIEDDETDSADDTAELSPAPEETADVHLQPPRHLQAALSVPSKVNLGRRTSVEEPSSPILKPWLAAGSSSSEDESKSLQTTGLHYCGKGYNPPGKAYNPPSNAIKAPSSFRDEEDMFMLRKGFTLRPPPLMFDSQSAVLSSIVIGFVGCLALGLRYCLDYRILEILQA